MEDLPNTQYTQITQDDREVFEILLNFQKEFQNFKNSKPGLLQHYFQKHNAQKSQYIKMKSGHEALGLKSGSLLSGQAAVLYNPKSFYIGEYKQNKKNGFGYHHFPNGLIYKGNYLDDKKTGGIVLDPKNNNFLVYVGAWDYDTYHGSGKLCRKNGQFYEGNFEKGLFQGRGVMSWPNGDKFVGDFEKSVRSGNGRFDFSNGDFYEGQFERNEFHGRGRYDWMAGDMFEGEFRDGVMDQGDMKYNIGVMGSGKWNGDDVDKKYSLSMLPPS